MPTREDARELSCGVVDASLGGGHGSVFRAPKSLDSDHNGLGGVRISYFPVAGSYFICFTLPPAPYSVLDPSASTPSRYVSCWIETYSPNEFFSICSLCVSCPLQS